MKKTMHMEKKLPCTLTFPSVSSMTRPAARHALVVVYVACALTGCSDARISVSEFRQREQAIREAEPVVVEPRQLGLTELQPYTIAPGDVLNVALTGLPGPVAPTIIVPTAGGSAGGAPTLRARVRPDGTVALPLVGNVQIAGLTLPAAEEKITAVYVPDYVKTLSVYVEVAGTDEPTTVLVCGAAGFPGLVSLKSNQRNLIYALSLSGAFGPGASGRVKVKPIRADQQEEIYDFADVNDVRRALQRPSLQSGDMLLVESGTYSAVYVIGLVNRAGALPVPVGSTLSVVQALAGAGGLRDFLAPKEGTLYRQMPDGSEVRVKLNIQGILEHKQPDLALQPGDVLEVPHTLDTRVREWAMHNLKIGPFGVGAFYDPVAIYTFRNNTNNNQIGFGQTLRDSIIYNATAGILNPAGAARP